MCGICGFLGDGSDSERSALVASMTATLRHRGPDAGGTYLGSGVALGHRRLSILELSDAGAQPMVSQEGCAIVFNGEIYNFRELRSELEKSGVRFRGGSDTEVVLHVYIAWGLEGLRKLEGIFSIALWDERVRRLVLMRDRLGVKPLFYSPIDGGIFFGSEIKALIATGRIATSVDAQAFSEYLWYGNAFEDRTMYGEVKALLPGSWLIAEAGRHRIESWWSVEQWLVPGPVLSFEEATLAVREAVDVAVARQLVADVPVGIFLSGGVDSTAIAATAVKHSVNKLSSFSVGFDFDSGINELPRARMVAERLGLDHHELHIAGTKLKDVIVDLAKAHDEPFADAANIPLYLLAKNLGGSVKVVLQGDGGDEMFAGYRRYAILRNAWAWSLIPKWAPAVLRRLGPHGERLSRLAAAGGDRDPAIRMALLLTVEAKWRSPLELLSPGARFELASRTDPFRAYRTCAARFAAVDPVQCMLLTDIHLQLPSQFLTKVDRATMAWGLEARVPLLDDRLASLAVSLPSRYKVRGTEKKVVLREAMRDRVPSEVLDGPKTGFGVPYEYWLKTSLKDMAHECLLSSRFLQRFDFDAAGISKLLEEHVSGRMDRGFMIWKLLQLSLWNEVSRRG